MHTIHTDFITSLDTHSCYSAKVAFVLQFKLKSLYNSSFVVFNDFMYYFLL